MPDHPTPLAEPRREYSTRLESRRDTLARHVKQHRSLGNFRLWVLFAAAATAFGAFSREAYSGWWLLVPAAAYFWLGSRLQRVETERTTLARAEAFYERALARLEDRWHSTGADGSRFLDEQHLYARDLDVFGEASLFRLLSNARTRMGEETLAAWLSAPAAPNVVLARQQAVVELAPNLELREDLAVMGEDVEAGVHPEALAAWGEREPLLENGPFRAVARVLSLLGAGAIAAFFVYIAAGLKVIEPAPATLVAVVVYFAVAAVTLVGVMLRFKSRTDPIIEEVDAAAADLALLSGVLARLEAEEFSSPRLRALRAELDVEGRAPSFCIRRLNFLTDMADSRHNQFVAWIGPLLLWDLHLAYALEDWRRGSGLALRRWLNAVGEMEALSSLAGYRYEHPDDVFPEFTAESPVFDGEELRHPLLAEEVAIANDVKIGGRQAGPGRQRLEYVRQEYIAAHRGPQHGIGAGGRAGARKTVAAFAAERGRVDTNPRFAAGRNLALFRRNHPTRPDHGASPQRERGEPQDRVRRAGSRAGRHGTRNQHAAGAVPGRRTSPRHQLARPPHRRRSDRARPGRQERHWARDHPRPRPGAYRRCPGSRR